LSNQQYFCLAPPSSLLIVDLFYLINLSMALCKKPTITSKTQNHSSIHRPQNIQQFLYRQFSRHRIIIICWSFICLYRFASVLLFSLLCFSFNSFLNFYMPPEQIQYLFYWCKIFNSTH
jgi:hypothetical protein